VQLIGTATEQDLIDRFDLQRSRYEGPTGIVGVVQDACTRADLSSASLWAAVPAYASQVPSPKASLALVERACEIIGTPAPIARLHNEATTTTHASPRSSPTTTISSATSPDSSRSPTAANSTTTTSTTTRSTTMTTTTTTSAGRRRTGPDPEVDSDELMAEVERFLRDQGGPEA
jgi:hypothetical protein